MSTSLAASSRLPPLQGPSSSQHPSSSMQPLDARACGGASVPARRRLPHRTRGHGDGSWMRGRSGPPPESAPIICHNLRRTTISGVAHEILTYDVREWTLVHAPGPPTVLLRDELSLHSDNSLDMTMTRPSIWAPLTSSCVSATGDGRRAWDRGWGDEEREMWVMVKSKSYSTYVLTSKLPCCRLLYSGNSTTFFPLHHPFVYCPQPSGEASAFLNMARCDAVDPAT
ncbi:hypothetical protein BD309DRAFT_340453 [Dichomitus squalens]|nr:hypothetical protein BD309DRAFT_340453 [Dichomitus squalens]